MIDRKEIVVNACNLFLEHNDVTIGYPNSDMKSLGYKRIILVNSVRVHKKHLGQLIFLDIEKRAPFKKKWPGLTKDLAEQLLCMFL